MKIRRKVWVNKHNGQKLVTIPKDSNIEGTDEVWIEKINKNYRGGKSNVYNGAAKNE